MKLKHSSTLRPLLTRIKTFARVTRHKQRNMHTSLECPHRKKIQKPYDNNALHYKHHGLKYIRNVTETHKVVTSAVMVFIFRNLVQFWTVFCEKLKFQFLSKTAAKLFF